MLKSFLSSLALHFCHYSSKSTELRSSTTRGRWIYLDSEHNILRTWLGWVIVPKVFIFTSTVIFPISYVPKVNLNQKYWIKIEIYYGFKPIKVLYYELLRGKKDIRILLQKSMKELNYWPQWVKVCLLGPPRLPKKIWGLWANPLYETLGGHMPQNAPKWAPGPIEGVGPQTSNSF